MPSLTSAVSEVGVRGGVVFAQALQDLLVVQQPVQRAQQEDGEGHVAHLLELKVSAQPLQLPRGPARLLQLQQHLRLLLQVSGHLLQTERDTS